MPNMYRCEAPNCKMRTFTLTKEQSKLAKNNYVVSFHKFPFEENKRKAWVEAAQAENWSPPEYSCLCSLHFRDDCFNSKNQLFEHAVPTIFFDDFENHIKAIVKEFNLDCGLSDNEDNEHEILHENGENSTDSKIPSDESIPFDENIQVIQTTEKDAAIKMEENLVAEVEEEDFDFVECEEVMVTEEPIEEDQLETPLPVEEVVKEEYNNKEEAGIANDPLSGCVSPAAISASPTNHRVQITASNASTERDGSSKAHQITCHRRTIGESLKRATSALENSEPSPASAKRSRICETAAAVAEEEEEEEEEDANDRSKSLLLPTNELFSMIQTGSLDKHPMMTPASKSLVLQLLNIVKLANSQGDPKGNRELSSMPSTYIITTKQEDEKEVAKREVTLMETSEIVLMISETIKLIKKGERPSKNNMSIICASPAIFLLRYISVKNCDPCMNSVYVITSENLIPCLSSNPEGCDAVVVGGGGGSENDSKKHSSLRTEQKSDRVARSSQDASSKLPPLWATTPVLSEAAAAAAAAKKSPSEYHVIYKKGTPMATSTPQTPSEVKKLKFSLPAATAGSGNSSLAATAWQSGKSFVPVKTITENKYKEHAPSSVLHASNIANTLSTFCSSAGKNPLQSFYSKSGIIDGISAAKSANVLRNYVSDYGNVGTTTTDEAELADNITDESVYIESQLAEIEELEKKVLAKENEISALTKKLQLLRKRYDSVKVPSGARTDEQIVEDILSKYIDSDGVQFFVGQMKVSGKTYTQFRWNTEDKLFALRLLYKNPVEYNILFQNYTLPSDKTLNKFVSKVKKAEMEDDDT